MPVKILDNFTTEEPIRNTNRFMAPKTDTTRSRKNI